MGKVEEEIAKAAARVQREKAANETDPAKAARHEREADKLTKRAERERNS